MCVWVLRSGLLLHLCGDDDILLPIRLILCIPCLSISLYPSLSPSLSHYLNLLYYLCPAPSAAQRSQVSPVEPDDKLRLLLRAAKRNSLNLHIYTQTRALVVTHSEEGLVNRVACWVRECVVVSNRGQSRSEEEARCDPKTFAQSFLLKKKLANRTRQIWRLQTPGKSAALPLLWRFFCLSVKWRWLWPERFGWMIAALTSSLQMKHWLDRRGSRAGAGVTAPYVVCVFSVLAFARTQTP